MSFCTINRVPTLIVFLTGKAVNGPKMAHFLTFFGPEKHARMGAGDGSKSPEIALMFDHICSQVNTVEKSMDDLHHPSDRLMGKRWPPC